MMADDSSLPFEFPTPSFSFGACVNCTRKDQELQTLRKDQATNQANFKALKQKIIATDQLLRKFKAKTDDCLKHEKDIEEWVRKYEKSQREVTVLEAQLRKALEDMEPVKRAKGELEKQLEKLEKEKEKLQTLLNEAEFLNNQYEMRVAGLESAKNSKEEASAESRRRHTALESKLKQRLNKINKLQTENKALKIEVTKHSRKEKRLETRLKRTENKLVKHLDVLVQHGLMTKKVKAKVMATVTRLDRNEDSDIGSLSDDDLSVSDLDTDPEDKEDKMNGKPEAVDEPLKSPDSTDNAAQNTTSNTSLDETPTPPVQSAWPVRPPAARKKKGVHSVRKAGEPRTLGRSLKYLEELTARPLLSPLPVSPPPSPMDDRAASPEPFTAEDLVSTLTDTDDSDSETTLDQDGSRKDNSGSALGSAQSCLPVSRQKRSEPAGLPAERTLSPARDGEEGEHAGRSGEKERVTLGNAAVTPRSETMLTSVCSLPQSAGTSASVCSLPPSAGTSASVCSLPRSAGTSASVCSLPQSAGTSASVCSLPRSAGTSASLCSLPQSAGTSASVCSLPQSAGTSASVCSLPQSAGTSASVCSLPQSVGTSASVCSLPQSAGTSASVCSLPQSVGTSASVCSHPRSAGTSASVCSLSQSAGTSTSVCSLSQSAGTSVCSLSQSATTSVFVCSLSQSVAISGSVCSPSLSMATSASVCSLSQSAATSVSACSLPSAESDTIDETCSMAPCSNSFNKNQPASSSVHLQSLDCDDGNPNDGSRTGKDFRMVFQASDHSRTSYRTDENSVTDGGTDENPKTGVGTAENFWPGMHSSTDSNDRTDHNYHQRGAHSVGPPPRALSTRQAVHDASQTDCTGREAVQETAAEDSAGPHLQHVHTSSGFQQESNLQPAESDPPTRSDTAAHDQEALCKERGLRGRLSEPHPCTMLTRHMSRLDSSESAQDDGNPSTQKKHSTPASLTVTPPNSSQRKTEKEVIEFGDWALEEKSGAVEGMLDDFLYSSSDLKSHEALGKRCSTSSEKENKDGVRKASPAQGRSALGDRQNSAPQQQGQQKSGQVAAEERKSFAHVQTHRPSPAPETAHERLSSSSSSSSSAASGSESEDTSDLSFSDCSLPPHTPSSGQGGLAGQRKTGKGAEGKQPSVKRREQLDVLQFKKKDAVLTGRKRKSPAKKVRGNVKSASDQGAPKSHVDTAPARSTPQSTTQNKLLQNTPQFTTKKIVQSTPQSMPAKASKQQTAYQHPDHIQDDSRADNLRTCRIVQKKKVPAVEDSESEEEETHITKLSSGRLKTGRPRQRRKTKSRAVIESDSSDSDDDSSGVPLHPSMAGSVDAPPSHLPAQENQTTVTVVGVCTEDPKRASLVSGSSVETSKDSHTPRSQNDLHLVPPAGQSALPAKESVATATASTKAFIEQGANLVPAETNSSGRATNDVDTSKDGPSPGSDSSSQDSQFVPVGLCHRYFYLDHQYAARSNHAGQHGAVSHNPPTGLSTDRHHEFSRRTEKPLEDCDTGSSETVSASVSQGAVCEQVNEPSATKSASTSMRQGVDCGKEQIQYCWPPSSIVSVKLNGCNPATMTRQSRVVCDTVTLAGVSNTAVTGETLRKTVIVAASENTVTGDTSENAIAGDTPKNTVTGDTSKNTVTGDTLKNMVTGDMSENCVTGDMSENCVTGDTDSTAQRSDRREQLSSALSPGQHSSSQSLQARGDQHAVGKRDAGDQGQGLSESEGHHLRPCTELSISDIEADCAQRQAPSHPGVIRPEAIMLKSPVLELSSPPHPSAADTSLPVNMGDNSGGSRAVTDSAGKQVGLLSPLCPLQTSPLLIGGTDHSGSSPFKRVSSDRRRSSSINDDHGQDETDVPSLLTTASSNSAQKASVTALVNCPPVFCASVTTTSSNSASCSKVSSVNVTSASQVSVVMSTHTSMSTASLTKSTSSSRSYVTSVNCLLSSVSATKPTSFPSAVKSTSSSMSSDVQRSEAGPVSHTHVTDCAWTTSEGESSYDSFQSSLAFSQPAECVLVSSATSSISASSVEASQPDPSVSASAPGGRLPDSRVAKCTDGPHVENQTAQPCPVVGGALPTSGGATGGLVDGGGSGDDCGGTDVQRQPVEVSQSPAGASTERLRFDAEPGTVHRSQGDHLLPEVTSKAQGLEPRTRDHALDICDRFCCVQHSISPLPSPQPFRECQKCLEEATPSVQNVFPQQPASMGRKKKKQKARQKKEMPLVSDAKKDAASQNAVIAASSSASQDSSTTTPNQNEAPAALSQGTRMGPSVTASGSSVSMQNQVRKRESPAHTMKGQNPAQGHDVKVSLPANQKDGGQQGTGLLGAVERAKRDLRLRQQALSEDQRTSGSTSPSGSGSLTPMSHTGGRGRTKEKGTAEGTTPQQNSCTDLTQTSMPTLSMSTRRKRKAKDSTSPASPPKRKGNVRCGKGAPAISLGQKVQDIVGDYYCEVSIPVETVIGQLKQIGCLSDCWVPIILTIVMLLKSENKDLQLDIVKACCGRGQQSAAARKQLSGRVFMDGTEIRFMHLLLRCMEVDSGCDRGRLMQMLWTSILSTNKAEKTNTTQRTSLCRLYVGLCGSLGSAEEVRALAFKVVMMGLDGFVTIVLAIAAVWPRPLTRHKPSETTGGVAVIKHLVMSAIADNPVTAKLGQCFERLCQWEPTTTIDAVSLMAQHIKALQSAFENGHKASSSPRAYELCRCVEMLCATNDTLWVIKNFLERPVRSSLLKWASKGEGGVPPHMVVAMCRLVVRIMRPDLYTKKKVLTQLISVQVRSVLFSPHKHPEVEAACVEMMLTLAPLKPPTIFGILQEYCKLYPSQLPLHLQDRVLAIRKLVNSRLQHKV